MNDLHTAVIFVSSVVWRSVLVEFVFPNTIELEILLSVAIILGLYDTFVVLGFTMLPVYC